MYIGIIREVKTETIDVAGDSLEAVRVQLEQRTPEGFFLTSAPVVMEMGTTMLTATGTYQAAGYEEISAETREQLVAAVPEGWQLLSIRDAS